MKNEKKKVQISPIYVSWERLPYAEHDMALKSLFKLIGSEEEDKNGWLTLEGREALEGVKEYFKWRENKDADWMYRCLRKEGVSEEEARRRTIVSCRLWYGVN